MCGRFAFFSPREAVIKAFPLAIGRLPEPRFNVTPSQNVLIIRADETETGGLITDDCRWGLVPCWAKDPSMGNRMINARAETVAEKPAYRQSFSRRRCLILADGFYEWQQGENGKRPYFISRRDSQPFGMAGLWDQWAKSPDEPLRSCTLMTVPANEFMQQLHHRMPVLLDWSAGSQWLKSTATAEHLLQLLLGRQSSELQAWPVSKAVNNPVNDSEQLITRVVA